MPPTILTYPNPLLKRISRPIETIGEEIRALAADMAQAMYEAEGIGLAAPQIGEAIRLVVVDITGPEKREGLMTLVNPRLTPVPECGEVESEEGCLSVPEFRAKVRRSAKVRLEASDLDGAPVDIVAEGLLAICLQHEVDHLDGTLFIDRISRLKRSLYDAKVRKRLAAGR